MHKVADATAVSGVAIAELGASKPNPQITIIPIGSPSGTGTVEAIAYAGDGYQTVFDGAGVALTSVDLSSEVTFPLNTAIAVVRVTSSNSSDEFRVTVAQDSQ